MLRRFVLTAIVLAGAALYLAVLAQSARASEPAAPRAQPPALNVSAW